MSKDSKRIYYGICWCVFMVVLFTTLGVYFFPQYSRFVFPTWQFISIVIEFGITVCGFIWIIEQEKDKQ